MPKNTETIKEFFLKYKRYLLAAAVLVILIIALVSCAMGDQNPQKGSESQNQSQSQGDTEIQKDDVKLPAPTESALDGELQKNANEELNTLFHNYYTAYANADFASLEMLATPITENEKSFISTFAAYYEAYENIECYSVQAKEDVYFVSVCYDLKFYDIDTLAPGMDFFYVERDGKGNLIINNVYAAYNFNFMEQELDANIYSMILSYEQRDEVVLLQQEVQVKYDEAVAGDEKLANMVGATIRNAITQWKSTIEDQGASSTEKPDTKPEENSEQPDTQSPEGNGQPDEDSEKPDEGQGEKPEENSESSENNSESGANNNTQNSVFTVRTKDICNIRAKASSDSELIGQVGKGAELLAVGKNGNWTKVQFSGGRGYIRSDLLEVLD